MQFYNGGKDNSLRNGKDDLAEPLFSVFCGDEIIEKHLRAYVATFSSKCYKLDRINNKKSWSSLVGFAHQLKGSFMTFGFPELAFEAANLESYLNSPNNDLDAEYISSCIESLNLLMKRAISAYSIPL